MGTRLRCFWVDGSGRTHHMGLRQFESIFFDGTETVPEFANRMVPVIEVVYETLFRRATRLIGARGYRFPFDADGRLDLETQRRLYRWGALLDEQAAKWSRDHSNIRRIDSRIAANRIRKEVFFDPTPEQIHAILLALGIVAPPQPPRPLRVIGARRARSDLPPPRATG